MKYLALALLLCACSPAWHLRRAEYHIKKAEVKGAKVTVDTVYVTKEVVTQHTRTDTIFQESTDTVRIEKEKLRIKYIKLPGDSVYITGECLPDTVKVSVPVTITKHIEAKAIWRWWHLVIALLAGALLIRVFGR